MKIIAFLILLISITFANVLSSIDNIATMSKGSKIINTSDKINLIGQVGLISKVTQKHLSPSKVDNIQNLLNLAIKENKTTTIDQFKYITIFKKVENGDKLLLKCLKNTACNLNNFSDLMRKSQLHVQIANKYPYMNLAQINHKVGSINENIMNKYFQSVGWTKIEGEIGRNGIDGLYIKKKNGIIVDVMVAESKYNKSGLATTKNGKQMSKEWVQKKITDLQNKYPNDKNYKDIQPFLDNNVYRATLWNLKTKDGKLLISLKKIHDKEGKVMASNIVGGQKMKINFNGNQEINIKKPNNEFHKKIVSWYKEEIK